ncbi:uncharacterized protein N7483_011222 [Penicillium malachiteum]|uniref:uncharacterized protein n=1 Tax=Penicillium malachiteum TaxID=1324776 RepID=UPI002548A6F0|nr:uncharacterized protein N7483_011222 [Penicillium malachiteum]KAJ5714041.1 hypothetical protein N7483_011222 [Penicillium malachiteum]
MSHRNQPRVLRACDSCTHSKQRCDGQQPCQRCTERDEYCDYTKTVRKRGRRPRSDSVRLLRREQRSSTKNGSSQALAASPPDTVVSKNTSSPDNQPTMSPIDSKGCMADISGTVLADHPTSSTSGHAFNPPISLQPEAFSGLPQDRIDNNPLETNQLPISPTYISPAPTSPLRTFRERPLENISNISTNSPIKQTYRCLDLVMPHLQGILTLQEASEMLGIFFTEDSNPLFKSTSPYMLAQVLHPSTLLQDPKTRPISPALIAAVLFCVTQTADMRIFDTPSARERKSVGLYRLSLDLLQSEDPDNYFRTSDGWQFHSHPTSRSPNNTHPIPDGQPSGKALLPRQLGSTDIILAVAILTLAISGGHYKADSLKWKEKLIRLVRASGLSMEDQDIDLGPVFCGLYNGDDTYRRWLISKEERRRLFWLIYAMDRHLGLSFNMRLGLPDSTFRVRTPLPEHIWKSLDTADLTYIPTCALGPPTQISGCGFFEYFLPLASLLGHIIDLHHHRNHPVLGNFVPQSAVHQIETMISLREQELEMLIEQGQRVYSGGSTTHEFAQRDAEPSMTETFPSPKAATLSQSNVKLVHVYSTYLLHVFHILLHGKWDPISMIEDKDDWITSESFLICASHALSATGVMSQILSLDPEMLFMPYLFGIYLLQGSFILLLFVDRMPELGPNRSVEEVCETIIRAHEKNFRKVFRSMLYDAQQAGPHSWDEHKARRRELLSLYRWTPLAHGLAY